MKPSKSHAARAFASLAAATVALTASSLALAAPAAAEDIRDIRAPWLIPAWWRWPLAIAVATVLALAVVAVVRWWQKRRARKLSPLEQAREALRIAETYAREGRAREWADVMAEALRAMLAARLGGAVLPQTTSELADAAWARWAYEGPVEENAERGTRTEGRLPEAPRIVELLRACDLARFAKASLETDALVENTRVARELVEALLAPRPKDKTPAPRRELVTP